MYSATISIPAFITDSWMPGVSHYASRWQVRVTTDTDWSAPFIDTMWDTLNLLSYFTGSVLDETVSYEARVATMDVVFLASQWSNPIALHAFAGPDASPAPHGIAGYGREQNLFYGTTDALLLVDSGERDRGEVYAMALRGSEIVPSGIGGDNVFGPLYLTIGNQIPTTVQVTPICDGRHLDPITVALGSHGELTRKVYEIDLREPYGGDVSLGVRGGSFTFQLDVAQLDHNRLEFHGCEVETDPVQETLPDVTYTPESLIDVDLQLPQRLFYGGASNMMQNDIGSDDNGASIIAIVGTDEIMPEGEGGEATYRTFYLALTRNNATTLTLELVPILEGVQLDPIEIVLAGVTGVIAEIIEISLTVPYMIEGVEVARFDARGNAIAFVLRSVGALPGGTAIIEHSELEYFTEQETLEPANG